MMYNEFVERTHYNPTIEEYEVIEESYYDFDGNKDDFCKQWVKDKKSGRWDREYKLRKQIVDLKAEYEEKLQEKEEYLEWYREQYSKLWEDHKKLHEIQQIINKK